MFYDEKIQVQTPSDAQKETSEIDYQEIENAFYNALTRINEENEQDDEFRDSTQTIDDYVTFSSLSDANYYTVGVDAPPASSSEQSTIYLVDIRNILLLFLFAYFVFHTYIMLKNSLSAYLGGKN